MELNQYTMEVYMATSRKTDLVFKWNYCETNRENGVGSTEDKRILGQLFIHELASTHRVRSCSVWGRAWSVYVIRVCVHSATSWTRVAMETITEEVLFVKAETFFDQLLNWSLGIAAVFQILCLICVGFAASGSRNKGQ